MTTSITLPAKYTYTANITAYDPVTKVATLDTPVNVSLGTNSLLYPGSSVDISSTYSIKGNVVNFATSLSGGTSAPTLSTDEAGNFVGVFNVPPNTFQTGTRIFRVDNRVGTDPTSATTYAEGTFTASGLSTQSQKLEFAPSVDAATSTFIKVNQLSNQRINSTNTISPWDPLAQTFIVSKDNYPNGVFLNSVNLFFSGKPTNNSTITVSIIPTVNGYPAGDELPYSVTTLTADKVNVSTTPHYLDTTTFTTFTFKAPVYIQPGVLYALKIHSSSPDYMLYYAQQNQTAIASTAKKLPTDSNPTNPTKIGSAPYIGALFESENGITWTADQTKDLMFVMDQCVFTQSTAVVPFVVPQNLPYRKLAGQDIINKLSANSASHTTGNYSTNRYINALNLTTTDFIPTSANIAYSYQATLSSGNIPTAVTPVTPGRFGSPTPDPIYLSDGKGSRILLRQSSNSFSLFATMSTSDPNVSPIISDDGISLYTVRYIINNMGIGNNVISITNPGSGYNVQSATITVSASDNGSNATVGFTANATGAITSVYVTNPGSGYITTPTITISDPTTRSGNSNAVISIIGETSPKGGNGIAKYFTKKVVLTPGNDSGDLRVFYTAYRPTGTNVYVYYKILSSQDTQPFESGSWKLMTTLNGGQAHYSASRSDLIEFECAPGTFVSGQADNKISYTSTNGQTYNNFIQFAIKVVMSASDKTNVPFLTDIRALALPAGTGI